MPNEQEEVRAALSLIGRSLGLDHLPLPDDDDPEVPFLEVDEAAEALAAAQTITPPAVLALLSHVAGQTPRAALAPIARSLIREDVGGPREQRASELLDLVYDNPGRDPLGREHDPTLYREIIAEQATGRRRRPKPSMGAGDTEIQPQIVLLESLVRDLEAVATLTPLCRADSQIIDDAPALSLSTTVTTGRPLEDVKAMSDPLFWDDCEPQSLFFKSMDLVDPPRPPPNRMRGPDEGWTARLEEVVDFSYGLNPAGSSMMTTELDFLHFESDVAFGCTYDLHRSRRRKITVDRGYVLVEDLRSIDVRRTTTLKQVYFRTRPQPGNVCRFWSLAHGMVATSCALPRRTD